MNMSNIIKAMMDKQLISTEEIATYGKDILSMLGQHGNDERASDLSQKDKELIREFAKNQEKALVLMLAKKIMKDVAASVEGAGESNKRKKSDRHDHFIKPTMTINDLKDKIKDKLNCFKED